jgi:hypothetical protein
MTNESGGKSLPTKLYVVISVLSAAMVAGYIVGRSTRWEYDNADTAHLYILMYSHWERLSTRPVRGRLSLKAGTQTFSYSTGDQKVTVGALAMQEAALLPVPREGMEKDFEKTVALVGTPAAGAGILGTLIAQSESKSLSRGDAAILIAASLGTGAIGYYFGHHAEPRYDAPRFQQALKEDITIWQEYESTLRRCYDMEVNLLLPSKPLEPIGGLSVRSMLKRRNLQKEGESEEPLREPIPTCRKLHPEIQDLAKRAVLAGETDKYRAEEPH